MIALTLLEITNAVRGELTGGGEQTVTEVVTDSRKVTEGSLFLALKGENFDGHDYIDMAYEKGCACVISEQKKPVPQGRSLILVQDTKRAILDLAGYVREQLHIPVVGVTGSVGKTTTKEFVYSVLSKGYKAMKTEGNFNNEIGLPLTIFRLERDTQAVVLEMGMSAFGEIEALSNVAKPFISIITNIGTAHMETLGSREGILKAKLEIVKGMSPNGYLVLNRDEPLLRNAHIKKDVNILYYGIENKDGDFWADDICQHDDYTEFTICGPFTKRVRINTVGMHNVYNALAASIVGYLLGIGPEKTADGLLHFHNASMRQNIYKKNDITIIDDCYNANPDSVRAAIRVLASRPGRRIAVLGDMLELGSYSIMGHIEVGIEAYQQGIDMVLCYGSESQKIVEAFLKNREPGHETAFFSSKQQLGDFLHHIVRPGDSVLFKGSRGMAMEELIPMMLGEQA